MLRRFALAILLISFAILPAKSQDIGISDLESRAGYLGPAEYFTGTAIVEHLFSAREDARAGAARVTFAPGARSAWHSHPRGQTLVVTSGRGWVQQRDGERREIKAGDVVWTPPGVEHWHGATSTHAMSHMAIQEEMDGAVVKWLELVSVEEYEPMEGQQ